MIKLVINADDFGEFRCVSAGILECIEAGSVSVKNTVNSNIENIEWQPSKEIDKEVKSEFSKYLSNSGSSQRVKDMANKLFMANNFQTLKNEQL